MNEWEQSQCSFWSHTNKENNLPLEIGIQGHGGLCVNLLSIWRLSFLIIPWWWPLQPDKFYLVSASPYGMMSHVRLPCSRCHCWSWTCGRGRRCDPRSQYWSTLDRHRASCLSGQSWGRAFFKITTCDLDHSKDQYQSQWSCKIWDQRSYHCMHWSWSFHI